MTLVSDVYQVFTELPAELNVVGLTAAEYKTVKALIKSRFFSSTVMRMVLPTYWTLAMDVWTWTTAVEVVLEEWHGKEKGDAVIVELAAYHRHVRELKASQPRHWKLLCERNIPVFDFWCGMNKFPLLQEIALQLFRCAASSSASERNVSAHAFIHSKLRNRLAPDHVDNLVHIYFNAKNICDEDIERYSHLEDLLRETDEEEDADDRNGGNESEDFVYY